MEEQTTNTMDQEKIIKETIEEVLQKLEVAATIDLKLTDNMADVVLDTQESGLIIGYHGEILESLQMILSLIVSKKIGHYVRVSLEVGDYKRNRTQYLERIAQEARQRALQEGRAIELPNLKSWERRIVHLLFQEDSQVTSESIGEGRDRILVVKPR